MEASEELDADAADDLLRSFFDEHCGHPLIAWAKYFDCNHDGKVDLDEFITGMRQMGYQDDATDLFHKLDDDQSGFLTISEVCPLSSDLWASFQHWASKSFSSEQDMIEKLSGRHFLVSADEKRKSVKLKEDQGISQKQFYNYASSLGWYGGFEQILYMTMDVDHKGILYADNLSWFSEQRKRQITKVKYKTRGVDGSLVCMRKRLHALRSLQAFTHWLKFRYGPRLFHPWRRGLDKDGSMTVTRLELITFCKNAGWHGDTNALWHALDSDESGVTSLDEFAGAEARQLALFKKWVDENFGNTRKVFNAINAKCRKKGDAAKIIDKDDFCFAVQGMGYEHDASEVFDILHWEATDENAFTYKEIRFLDSWDAVGWLSATPNPEAAEAFKTHLFSKWKHSLKAWRALDEDGSGKVSFQEFAALCARIGFREDIQGAWMSLDSDASGYIALKEIDANCANMLAEFRRWANLFFGSVMEAFRAFDVDQGGALSHIEFKKGAFKYSFRGDREALFHMLDTAGNGDISIDEIAFLDEWEITEVNDDPIPSFQEVENLFKKHRADCDEESVESDEEDMDELELDHRANMTRGRVTLKEHDLPDAHKPMPGTELMELLGEVSSRPKLGIGSSASRFLPNLGGPQTCSASACTVAMASSHMASPTMSCVIGSQRRSSRQRKPVTKVYTGGIPFRSRRAHAVPSLVRPRSSIV